MVSAARADPGDRAVQRRLQCRRDPGAAARSGDHAGLRLAHGVHRHPASSRSSGSRPGCCSTAARASIRGVSPAELAYIESDPTEPERPVSWLRLLRTRETWAYIAGRFLIDPIWWTFLFWLPDFFAKRYGIDLKGYGPPLVAIYILADLGSIAGGWSSTALLKRGFSLNAGARRRCWAVPSPWCRWDSRVAAPSVWIAVGLIGLACAGHQGFSANLYALPSDLFPRWAAGSVVGLGARRARSAAC